jgi:ribosomal protein S18 acetylase RimI-like enzyme
MLKQMQIKPYTFEYEQDVIELWEKCGLTKPWNNPKLDIERKISINPELFLIGLIDGRVIASAMGGYEGHRGWVYYLAVAPEYQREGLGRQIMSALEARLLEKGCPKINLQVLADNSDVVKFFESSGYKTEERISMGKRLLEDTPECTQRRDNDA